MSNNPRQTSEELCRRGQALMDAMTPRQRERVMTFVQALTESGLAQSALKPGDTTPDFILPDSSGRPTRLHGLLNDGPVVLVFYRGGWCQLCRTYLKALAKRQEDIEASGATLLAVSPQLPDESLHTEVDNCLGFPVISDVGLRISRRFGLVYELTPPMRRVYREIGIDLKSCNGDAAPHELPLAATFIIRSDRTIHTARIDEDPSRRLDPDDIVATLIQLA